jgi:hypothetical protein
LDEPIREGWIVTVWDPMTDWEFHGPNFNMQALLLEPSDLHEEALERRSITCSPSTPRLVSPINFSFVLENL